MRTDGSCWQFRQDLVGDDPEEIRRAEAHADSCAECAAILDADRRILDAVAAWREQTPSPSADLKDRIGRAMAAAERGVQLAPPSRRRRRGWLAAAAAAVLVGIAGTWLAMRPAGELERAQRDVARAERAYAEAIARLQVQADAVLTRAGDPAVDPGRAAILLAYQDRLAHLDAVLLEVGAFLEEQPGHAGAHTVLLAAYREKQEVLQQVLELGRGGVS